MPEPPKSAPASSNPRLQALLGHEFFAPHHWKRRLVLWAGAVLVALAAILFAKASVWSYQLFLRILDHGIWIPLILTPLVFGLLAQATEGRLRATRGSGIPQVIASLHIEDGGFRTRMLSLPVAAGKMVLTLASLAVGASIGREGPTVHVGAALFYSIGRRFGFSDPKAASRFVLAGGAAGVAAAFNTPLAGVVFAIEELSHSFEARTSGTVLTAVIISGIATLSLVGNYAYFGTTAAQFDLGAAWQAVALCGVAGGVLGGTFSAVLVRAAEGVPGRVGRWLGMHPLLFAALCGLALAGLGLLSAGATYGTGYAQARGLVEGRANLP